MIKLSKKYSLLISLFLFPTTGSKGCIEQEKTSTTVTAPLYPLESAVPGSSPLFSEDFPGEKNEAEVFDTPNSNLFVPEKLGRLGVRHKGGDFFVVNAEGGTVKIDPNDLSEELREAKIGQLRSSLQHGFYHLSKIGNAYGLKYNPRIRGGGSLAASMGYGMTKAIVYVTFLGGLEKFTGMTARVMGAPHRRVIKIEIGVLIAGVFGTLAAQSSLGTAVSTVVGAKAIPVAVSSFLMACPFLP